MFKISFWEVFGSPSVHGIKIVGSYDEELAIFASVIRDEDHGSMSKADGEFLNARGQLFVVKERPHLSKILRIRD